MKELSSNKTKFFPILFITISVIVFIIVALRSYYVPLNHDEAATFFFFIHSGNYLPFHSAADANNHVLNSFLGNLCFHVFGSSPFSLRIPNLIGLLVLIAATCKISKRLNLLGSKLILTAAFLLSFHWLSFFSACRGYGLSLALLLLSISFMLDYIMNSKSKINLLLTILLFQLAISSNLILVIVVLLLSAIILFIQLTTKSLFKPFVIILWLLHFGAIYYWLTFSFYLQANGALYYGEGDSYWLVTFVSLIQLLVGTYSVLIKWIIVIFVLLTIGLFFYINKKDVFKFKSLLINPNFSILFFVIFWSLVAGFYLMHILFGVNFPEDRTGLFFYVFFILGFCFTIDRYSINFNKISGFSLMALMVIHFAMNLNFRKHSLNVYETIPERFYTTLLNEQLKSTEKITIGGHRVRELFYGFLNYRNGGILNSADPTEVMQMNCDYYIATKPEEKYFKTYYDIIDSEPDWGFLLLKRKEKITRTTVIELHSIEIKNNESEFIDIYGASDTTIVNTNPLLAEIDFDVEKIPIPVNAWFVLQVNDSLDQTVYFKRYPLQWSGYNLNGRNNIN